jgi:hypothetical protein
MTGSQEELYIRTNVGKQTDMSRLPGLQSSRIINEIININIKIINHIMKIRKTPSNFHH